MKKLFQIDLTHYRDGKHGEDLDGTSKQLCFPPLVVSWSPKRDIFASIPANHESVKFYNLHGEELHSILLPREHENHRQVIAMEWDISGSVLAILEEQSHCIFLLQLLDDYQISPQIQYIETNNMNQPSLIVWNTYLRENSNNTDTLCSLLAVGDTKGNLLIYNHKTKSQNLILGKHLGRITCGTWFLNPSDNMASILALGSEDHQITFNSEDGDTLAQINLNEIPKKIFFSKSIYVYEEDPSQTNVVLNIRTGNTIVLILLSYTFHQKHDKILMIDSTQSKFELQFECENGEIISHIECHNGIFLVGFSTGKVVAFKVNLTLSSDAKSVLEATQVWSCQIFKKYFVDFSYYAHSKKVALAGDSGVVFLNVKDEQSISQHNAETNLNECDTIHQISWSPYDGKTLLVTTSSSLYKSDTKIPNCRVIGFIACIPSLYSTYGSKVAFLTSLREVRCRDFLLDGDLFSLQVPFEPTFIALGPCHIALCVENKLLIHRFSEENQMSSLRPEVSLKGEIKDLCLNSQYAAILFENGHLSLQNLKQNTAKCLGDVDYAYEDNSNPILCIALTEHFLMFATKNNIVEFLILSQKKVVKEMALQHEYCITKMVPNFTGTYVVLLDTKNDVTLYNPLTSDVFHFPMFESNSLNLDIFWDSSIEKNSCSIYISDISSNEIHSYIFCPTTVLGPTLMKNGPVIIDDIGSVVINPESLQILDQNLIPVLSNDGVVKCWSLEATGENSIFMDLDILSFHTDVSSIERALFLKNLILLNLESAWEIAVLINEDKYWLALGNKAMHSLDVPNAIEAYRKIGDVGMVTNLQRLLPIEDTYLLVGHLLVFFMNYDAAEESFLISSCPLAALQMRQNLSHWNESLNLATSIAPHLVSHISLEYAQQLEFRVDNSEAKLRFEQALKEFSNYEDEPVEYRNKCIAGIARTSIKLGQIKNGIRIAKESMDKSLCNECAELIESTQEQPIEDVAELYEIAGNIEKAIEIFIIHKKLFKVSKMIHSIECSSDLYLRYASLCESAGDFSAAAYAYTKAGDVEAALRLYLGLKQPMNAIEVLTEATSQQSSGGAIMLATYFQENMNFKKSIEYWLLANEKSTAFELALNTEELMNAYIEKVGEENIDCNEAEKIATFYASSNNTKKAGHYFTIGKKYGKALQTFLNLVQDDDKEGRKMVYLEEAIEVVGKAHDDAITHILINFLMGETDGQPKDPYYVYKLYMALGNYIEAANTTFIIAEQEQLDSNYDKSHSVVCKAVKQLDSLDAPVPQSLRQMFVLLHTYRLVKILSNKDHEHTARLLLRIAKEANQFPKHQARILISTVIECQKSGLKYSAYEWARYIYSNSILKSELENTKFKKKIRSIIRNPPQYHEEKSENLSMCPISKQLIPETSLECPTTKDAIPVCVCTGKHMILDDWCFCPVSGFPALFSEYIKYTKLSVDSEVEGKDPVFGYEVSWKSLKQSSVHEALDYIKKYNKNSNIS